MLEYRGSCFVLALKPGSIFFVASTTSSIESFCVVVNVCTWRENRQHTGRCTTTMTTPTNVPLNCRMSSQPRWTVDVHVASKKTSRLYPNSKGGLALSSSGNVQSILSDESPKETRPTPYLRKVYPIQSEWENTYLDAPVPKLYVGPPNPQHLFSICLRRRPSLVHSVCEVGQGVATLVAPPVVVAVGIDNSSCSSGWRGEGESDKRALQAYTPQQCSWDSGVSFSQPVVETCAKIENTVCHLFWNSGVTYLVTRVSPSLSLLCSARLLL